MLDFGTTNDNANSLDFGDLIALKFTGDFTVAMHSYMDSIAGTWAYWFFKHGTSNGWIWRMGNASTDKPQLVIGDGATNDLYTADTAVNADTTVRSYMAAFDVAPTPTVNFYVAGVADGSPTDTNVPTGAGANLLVNHTSLGSSGARGHVMAWNALLGQVAATDYNVGTYLPFIANLVFWMRGVIDPGQDQVDGIVSTAGGTVDLEVLPLTDWLFKDGDSFTMNLSEIFLPFLYGSAAQLGSNLLFNKIEEHTVKRCYVDWYKHELATLCDTFRRRPSWAI